MKVLEVWFTPHCIDNLVKLHTDNNWDLNFDINKVKKMQKCYPHPLNFKSVKKIRLIVKKIILRKPTELQVWKVNRFCPSLFPTID